LLFYIREKVEYTGAEKQKIQEDGTVDKIRHQTSETFRLSALLALSGGFQDAYTYNVRDGVFSNAQTGNVVLMSQNLMMGQWGKALHYLFPVVTFALGVLVAEGIRYRYQKFHLTWVGEEQGESLAYFADELSRELDVTIVMPDGETARLIFPEYREIYEENCPAHHFDYNISGAGYPYHY